MDYLPKDPAILVSSEKQKQFRPIGYNKVTR